MISRFLALLLLSLSSISAVAQQRIDERFPASDGGEIEIVNVSGRVRVTGWDRPEVRVTGTLGEGTRGLEIDRDPDRPALRVVIPRGARNVRGSVLEVRVPSGKSLIVRTVSADIGVQGVTGAIAARSTSGDVELTGSPREVRASSTSGDLQMEISNTSSVIARTTSGSVRVRGSVRESVSAESVSGRVLVDASSPEVRAKAVSGDLSLRRVSGRISASSVSGDIEIRDSRVRYASVESVSGDLLYQGELVRGGALSFRSHSGGVELIFPRTMAADLEAKTFSGDIRSDFGGEVQRTNRYGPGRELRLSSRGGGGLVSVNTFSGDVKLRRR